MYRNNWPRRFVTNAAVSASSTPFDEEVCVRRGCKPTVGLVDVRCWEEFSFADVDDFGRAFADSFFDVFEGGFWELGI